jgi:8-oxo-dGTP pyrophosphatase MutT (NUDIX family)
VPRPPDLPATGTFVVAAVAFVRDNHVLAVRKAGTHRFMLPGGKLEPGESARDAAVREVSEEIGVDVHDLVLLGEFENDAANEPGHRVESTVYLAALPDEPVPAGEIAQLRWVDLAGEHDDLAPLLVDSVMPLLRERERNGRA